MEAVNGVSESGPPPPSPLTGCYLLIVIGEPQSQEHKDIILRRVAKGLLSWDLTNCLVDLDKELAIIYEQALEGEEARYGERLIQYASENLVTEILIHPAVSTLSQCVRNLLSSFTRHRHIIHSGYTFASNGSWALQDGTFSLADFSEAFQEIEVQRVIRAYENSITVDIHCSPEGDWMRLPKESFAKNCKVRLNPDDVLPLSSPSITNFLNYISPFLIPLDIETALESSEVVGNIRFSHPTLYVFPGGQGDAALFGINGFNMLLDGGFSRKACFWDFVRHLDRLDAVLLTRLNNSNVCGISSVLRRKRQNAVYPQIGHFFCNIQERKTLLSPDGDKDKDPLLINLLDEGHDIVSNLKHLNLMPQTCYRDSEPINLYHKVGHGTLDMYVLSPARESKEVRDFMQKWNNNDNKLFANIKVGKDFTFPLPNLVSICALLIWQPSNPDDNITRILYPGSTPQNKIFEGLDRLRQLDCIKHPICTEKTLTPSIVKKSRDSILDKIIPSSEKTQKIMADIKKERTPRIPDNKQKNESIANGDSEKAIKKSDSTDSDKSAPIKPTQNDKINNGKTEDKPKPKLDVKSRIDSKPPQRRSDANKSVERKPKTDKKPSPTTPKKTLDAKLNGDTKPKLKISPESTPGKSAKEANNRKVLESKTKVMPKREVKKEPAVVEKKEVKTERKPISRRPKTAPSAPPKPQPVAAAAAATGSPAKKVTKPDSIAKKMKLEKDATTDSSTVSTPSAEQENKRDISKLTPEDLEQLKAQELADLKEEQEVVQEIEAVFRKGEERDTTQSEHRKIKSISIEEKTDEEYLIVEKEAEDAVPEEDETQKHVRDSEESEKQRKLSGEIKVDEKVDEKNEEDLETVETKDEVEQEEVKEMENVTKEVAVTSPEDKIDSDKKVESDIKDVNALESQPDEKFSATIESGATTAPTLPEDERIPLDEIKEDIVDQVIEEKYVKEETKEKEIPIIQLPAKTFEPIAKVAPVVGIRLDKQSHIRDIVKTPDEVADLPVHEVADQYGDYQDDGKKEQDNKKKTDEAKEDKPVEAEIGDNENDNNAVNGLDIIEDKEEVKAIVDEIIAESKDNVLQIIEHKEKILNETTETKEKIEASPEGETHSKETLMQEISNLKDTKPLSDEVADEKLAETAHVECDKLETAENVIKEVLTETKLVSETASAISTTEKDSLKEQDDKNEVDLAAAPTPMQFDYVGRHIEEDVLSTELKETTLDKLKDDNADEKKKDIEQANLNINDSKLTETKNEVKEEIESSKVELTESVNNNITDIEQNLKQEKVDFIDEMKGTNIETETKEVIEELSKDITEKANQVVEEVADKVVKNTEELSDKLCEDVKDVTDKVIKNTDELSDKISEDVKEVTDKVTKNVEELPETITEDVAVKVVKTTEELSDKLSEDVKETTEKVLEEVKDIKLAECVKETTEKVSENLKDIEETVIASTIETVETIKTIGKEVKEEIAVSVSNKVDEIVDDRQTEGDAIKEQITDVVKSVDENIASKVQDIKETADVIESSIKEVEEKVIGEIKILDEEITKKVDEIKESVKSEEITTIEKEIVKDINDASAKCEEVKELVEETKEIIKESVIDVLSKAKEIAKEDVIEEVKCVEQTIINNTAEKVTTLKDELSEKVGDAIDTIKAETNETIDLAKKEEQQIVHDVQVGIDRVKATISDVATKVEEEVKDAEEKLEEVVKDGINKAEELKETISEDVKTVGEDIKDQMVDKLDKVDKEVKEIVNKASALESDVKEELKDIITNVKDETQKLAEEAKDFVMNIKDTLSEAVNDNLKEAKTLDDTIKEEINESVDVAKSSADLAESVSMSGEKLEKEIFDDTEKRFEIDSKNEEEEKAVKCSKVDIEIQNLESPEHAEVININSPDSPKLCSTPGFKELELIDKMDLGRKSPKEREQDVAKIVASVAEVLKSEAPLEEFKGKIPLAIEPFTSFGPFTTELRETHITTVDSPTTDLPGTITPIKEEKIDEVLKEMEEDDEDDDNESNFNNNASKESKINELIKNSNELLEASSRMISDIKSARSDNDGEETSDNGTVTVTKMLVTASSEDGGEETVICPAGSITFVKSSESSGRSTPDGTQKEVKKDDASKLDELNESSTPNVDVVKEKEDKPAKTINDNEKEVVEEKIEEVNMTKTTVATSSSSQSDNKTEIRKIIDNKEAESASATQELSKPETNGIMPTDNLEISEKMLSEDIPEKKDKVDGEIVCKTVDNVSDEKVDKKEAAEMNVSTTTVTTTTTTTTEVKEQSPKDDDTESSEFVEKHETEELICKKDYSKLDNDVKSGKVSPDPKSEQTAMEKCETKDEQVDKIVESNESKLDVINSTSGKSTPTKLTMSGKSTPDISDDNKLVAEQVKDARETPDLEQTNAENKLDKSDVHTIVGGSQSENVTDVKETLQNNKPFDEKDLVDETTQAIKSSTAAAVAIKDEMKCEISITGTTKSEIKTFDDKSHLEMKLTSESSGKSTPDIKESVDLSGKSTPVKVSSGKVTPDIKEDICELKADEKVSSGKTSPSFFNVSEPVKDASKASSRKSSYDSGAEAGLVLSGSQSSEKQSGKSTPALKDELMTDIESEEKKLDASGKSTPDISKEKISSGKSTPKDLLDEQMSIASNLSRKSTPDLSDRVEIKETILSGKSTPHLQDEMKHITVLSGKSTPDIKEDSLKVLGKSTPDLPTDVISSGKTTPDVALQKMDSGKSTPDIKCEIDKKSTTSTLPLEKQAADLESTQLTDDLSKLKSAHVYKELMEETIPSSFTHEKTTMNGDVVHDLSEMDDFNGKKDAAETLTKDDTLHTDVKEFKSGKSSPDIKDSRKSSILSNVSDVKEEFDSRKFSITSENTKTSSILSGKSTPDMKDDIDSKTSNIVEEKPITIKDTIQDFLNAEREQTIVTAAESEIIAPGSSKELNVVKKLDESNLSGKSTPDIADFEKIKEMQEILTHEKHIPGSSTPPTVPVSPIVKDIKHVKEEVKEEAEKQMSESEDELPSSPLSVTSQIDYKPAIKMDPMNTSFYGALPDDEPETKSSLHGEGGEEELPKKDDLMMSSFIGTELPSSSSTSTTRDEAKKDPIESWGKPLGLPSPAPPTINDNKGTPKKERRVPANVSVKNKLNDDRKRSESPSKKKRSNHVYVDLTYVPHHGNSYYSYVDFFKRVRARYYVFSGIEPSKEVYNALLEAKQTWDDKDLEVTIIPTYDTDVLGYWVAENEELLTKYKIDLSPSASRCTINLQDHETSCSAYRLEF